MLPGPFAASAGKNYARFRQFFSVLVSRNVPLGLEVLAPFNPLWPLLNLRVARFEFSGVAFF
jgi:hypothetical protein